MKMSATGPAALTSRNAPTMASGRTTAWIHRGTTTGSAGATGAPAAGGICVAAAAAASGASTSARGLVLRLLHDRSMRARAPEHAWPGDGALASAP